MIYKNLTKMRISFLCVASLLLPLTPLSAYDDSPACFKEFETNFFPYDLLSEALSMSGIGQSQWTLIYQELKGRSGRIVDEIQSQARQMHPNPLDNPFNPEQAEKILLNVLYAEFDDVMRLFSIGVPNPLLIRSTFDYIRSRQARKLKACLESQHTPSFKRKPNLKY
jgi:hypothetical protein